MSAVFLLAEFLFISSILLGLARIGTTPVLVVVAAMQFLQAVLASTMYWEFADGLLLSPASCVLFASNVAILLYIYVSRGASAARSIFYTIVGSNLIVAVFSALLFAHIEAVPPVNFLGLPPEIFETSWSTALVGTTVLALTQLIALTLFNRIQLRWPSAPIALPMTLALTGALIFDTFGYLVPLFWADPNLASMLESGVVSKGAAGVVFGVTWGLWAQRNHTQRIESLRRLFDVLMFADEAESFRTDTAELYRKSELDTADESGAALPAFAADQDWTEDKLRRWLTQLPYGVCVISGGRIRLANSNFAAQVGETLGKDLGGRSIDRYVHRDDLDKLRRASETPEERGGGTLEHEVRRADQSSITLESVALPMSFEGSPATVLMARDITEKKQLRDQISHADRLVSIGTLTATVAHEINNPLAYLLSNQDYLIETIARLKHEVSPKIAATLDTLTEAAVDAREGAQRIKYIVNELGTFTRTENHEVLEVDMAEVIDSSINMAMPQIKHRAQLVVEVDDLPRVKAHPQRLGQVVLNLLVNAAHAIEDGAADDHEICVSAATEDNSVVVHVRDTGSGIDPLIQGRIMEPFFTTKPASQGTGLGLATCQSIIESFGGEMGFHSTQGKGSTFWFSLPISSTHAPAANDDSAATPDAPSLCRILFIDDERALARAFVRMMGSHEVTICSSGGEALALLDEDHDFDIVFCDLMMPNITGMQLYKEFVERGSKLAERMVFMTGSAYASSAHSFLEAVDLPCLQKPFDWEQVHALIEERAPRPGSS